MRRDFALFRSSGRRADDISKRIIGGNAPQTARVPFAQVVLHSTFARFAKESPRLPRGARHHGYFRKFSVGILGTIPTTKSLHQPDDFTALFEAGLNHGQVDEMRKDRIGCDENVRAGRQNSQCTACKFTEEIPQCGAFFLLQNRKPGERAALAPVKRGWDAPYPPLARAKFSFFLLRVFFKTVWRVRDYCVNGVRLACRHPFKAIAHHQRVVAHRVPTVS